MNTDHIDLDWFNQKIRQTDDGRASVLDLIRNAITGRSERKIWQRLKAENPELEGLTDSVTFRDAVGRGGANATPVVDQEGWLQILPLLPGAAGKKYRKRTAELVLRVWQGDADLGLEIMLRDADKERLARAKARIRVTSISQLTTDSAMKNNERPDYVHNARYRGYYKKNTGAIREEMGISKSESPLNFMNTSELSIHEAIMAIGNDALDRNGGSLQSHVNGAAKKMRSLYEESVGAPPSLPDPTKVGHMDPQDARAISVSHDAGQLGLFGAAK